jgi:DNA-binding XRE family transcriptional regulator
MYRKRLGYTQTSIAKVIGASRPTVAKIERGDRSITTNILERYCRVIGVPVEEFFFPNLTLKGDKDDNY